MGGGLIALAGLVGIHEANQPPPTSTRPSLNDLPIAGVPSTPAASPPPDDDNNRRGGGRNAQKSNPDRVAKAKENLDQARSDLKDAKSSPNKTPEQKAEIKRLENQVKHFERKLKDSENHSMKDKG